MTRILVQRGSAGSSSSNPNRQSSLPSSSTSAPPQPQVAPAGRDDESREEPQEHIALDDLVEYSGIVDGKLPKSDDLLPEITLDCQDNDENVDSDKVGKDLDVSVEQSTRGLSELKNQENENEGPNGDSMQLVTGSSHPPPPPAPPPKPSSGNSNSRRHLSGSSNSPRIGSSRRAPVWPSLSNISTRTSPTGSKPSSPRSHGESEGYNSADEQSACFASSYDDAERERQFEIDIRRTKGLEVKRMLEDGNCLFRAVADQVYGDSEGYDLVRQMCIDYMLWSMQERERDHFSQFITEGFTSYCRRKRRDKVYGNNVEIQALAEMYNRPIHIYSYSPDPINIFHGSYNTDIPPIRLSYHHGNHYNSLVDPRRLTIGAGLGFGSLRGRNVDKDQIKAAIKAQQDQQIDNALLAEGRFYSDLELTEKEIERMVMEASRSEYLAGDKFKQQIGWKETSTSGAEPSSSGARPSGSETMVDARENALADTVLSSSMQMVLSMGFSYLQVIEAYSIFGDDVDSVVCYLLETGNSSRRKGKATE
ncbi:OVARIAN TUMOR DOMAIN-containing deubiquitinating enzyme 6 isoform X1 [Diospyros lotus]|uniref:OVARIAN TUMOR DOMAIN-containing deubiquitinating enzyme 6 isoform X1 n=1 Tax=Diospyros lotus TaxID=55363 RepID=UPI00224D16EB|nr:OVARIAN TUMOR DOMAIN-containing deubiquitinating enzyme 6 isoform X1 [Diospyros lotus]XP_052195572.1 OVARIAN TUMOR DOMAIN-containing deubiquitinating enzyme 6 isoform X1 [Diospyros lotus]XP_052195580.1 OVARIAN TUMOR DOMAIN-containing deubiquitinating enzyme 6 isoform X1 [Diospyros lotus]XP_052195589.1 OVARIAN TUMOR DOMAIN-containing deubiquitinating enzyme 6 isoform X1 [Diospyros lotus]